MDSQIAKVEEGMKTFLASQAPAIFLIQAAAKKTGHLSLMRIFVSPASLRRRL